MGALYERREPDWMHEHGIYQYLLYVSLWPAAEDGNCRLRGAPRASYTRFLSRGSHSRFRSPIPRSFPLLWVFLALRITPLSW